MGFLYSSRSQSHSSVHLHQSHMCQCQGDRAPLKPGSRIMGMDADGHPHYNNSYNFCPHHPTSSTLLNQVWSSRKSSIRMGE